MTVADLYRLPTDDNREVTTIEPDELILELDVPRPEASTYLKAMDRRRFSFAIVGVLQLDSTPASSSHWPGCAHSLGPRVARRARGGHAAAGLAYKVEVARTLVRRAVEAVS